MLKHRKVLVTVSSFPVEASPNKPRFIAAMEKNNINYTAEDKIVVGHRVASILLLMTAWKH
ncbi:MAG: hypothetical protein MZV70_16590 [Desulfobacterales bacterium]|nr:hypothetical protein [Desulfobacterales bacterium]